MTGTSTREMGPGSRHDTLEDHFGNANWQKLVTLGMCSYSCSSILSHVCSGYSLGRRLSEATIEKITHDRIYEDFTKELQAENVEARVF